MTLSAVTSLQDGLGQHAVMRKLTVPLWASETFTALLDGNVFISPSKSSRDIFVGS